MRVEDKFHTAKSGSFSTKAPVTKYHIRKRLFLNAVVATNEPTQLPGNSSGLVRTLGVDLTSTDCRLCLNQPHPPPNNPHLQRLLRVCKFKVNSTRKAKLALKITFSAAFLYSLSTFGAVISYYKIPLLKKLLEKKKARCCGKSRVLVLAV